MSSVSTVLLLALIPLLPSLVKYFIQYILRAAGYLLRRKTQGRRELILGAVRREAEDFRSGVEQPRSVEDEDWEQVEKDAAHTIRNDGLGRDADWDGVIGFFHPFW